MNPTHLKAVNLRTFPNIDLDLPTGAVGVVGSNGAGKSTIIYAVDIALFGPEGRSLDPYLSESAIAGDTLLLELEFEHRGDAYRVRRTFTRSGKSGKGTLDFERLNERAEQIEDAVLPVTVRDLWEPLTQGTVADTQNLIDATLGLSRDTFRASSFLAQRHGSDFTDAAPRDRKRILADALGLGFWDRCSDLARTDRRQREKHVETLNGRIALLDEQVAGHDRAAVAVERHKADLYAGECALDEATNNAATAAKAHEAIAERVRNAIAARAAITAARTQLAALERELAHADTARQAADTLGKNMGNIQAAAAELAAMESERDTLTEAKRERDLQRERRASVEAELKRVRAARTQKTEAIKKATERRNDLIEQARVIEQTPGAECDRCGQGLPDDARALAVKNIFAEANLANLATDDLERQDDALAESELQLGTQLEQFGEATVDEAGEARFAHVHARCTELRGAREQLATATERLSGLQAAATPRDGLAGEIADAERALRQHTAELEWADEPEPGSVERAAQELTVAVRAVDVARLVVADARAKLTRAQTQLEAVDQSKTDRAAAVAERDRIRAELDELHLLERAFGRDGVPTWVLETSAIPALEVEADRLLHEFGTGYRVELRTERELKSGAAAETLDVAVLTDRGARPYETFSGGERTRINLALRIALARLLANRRGAASRWLALDEPEHLDEAGTAALVSVLRALDASGEFDRVMLVSHVPTLRDAFDATLNVVKVDGRSEVTVG